MSLKSTFREIETKYRKIKKSLFLCQFITIIYFKGDLNQNLMKNTYFRSKSELYIIDRMHITYRIHYASLKGEEYGLNSPNEFLTHILNSLIRL